MIETYEKQLDFIRINKLQVKDVLHYTQCMVGYVLTTLDVEEQLTTYRLKTLKQYSTGGQNDNSNARA